MERVSLFPLAKSAPHGVERWNVATKKRSLAEASRGRIHSPAGVAHACSTGDRAEAAAGMWEQCRTQSS